MRIEIDHNEYKGARIILGHVLHETMQHINIGPQLLRCWGLAHELIEARLAYDKKEAVNYSAFGHSIDLARKEVRRESSAEANYWAEVLFALPMLGLKTGEEKLSALGELALANGDEFKDILTKLADNLQLPTKKMVHA
jgi:HD-like signal output (HDOD) protein